MLALANSPYRNRKDSVIGTLHFIDLNHLTRERH